MRRISCAITQEQVLDQTKTATRRLGWLHAKVGDRLLVVDKVMGLQGRLARGLAVVRLTNVFRQRLDAITAEDVAAEGFPGQTPEWFVRMFAEAMGCSPDTEVTVMEWVYEGGAEEAQRVVDEAAGQRSMPWR